MQQKSSSATALCLATLAFGIYMVALRIAWPQPWDYDEYFHVGLARELRQGMPPTLHWTPFSIAAERFVDKEPLFHYALTPFAHLPLEHSTLAGVVMGLVLVLASLAWVLWRVGTPHAWLFVLALSSLGTLLPQRLGMCRPHQAEIGFSILVLGLLAVECPAWVLAVTTAVFGLSHTSGWIAIGYAVIWAVVTVFKRAAPLRRVIRLVSASAIGWIIGQLLHPSFPENFRLLWVVNVVVPYRAAAGQTELRHAMGLELRPPDAAVLLDQWPVLVLLALLAVVLCSARRRSPMALTAAVIGAAFTVSGALLWRRFFELGPPLLLLALAFALSPKLQQAVQQRSGTPLRRTAVRKRRWLPAVALIAILGIATWTTLRLRNIGFGVISPPRAMATWLGANGAPGERVFTVQWADSAPLLWAAPQLQSMVAPDPTYFWLADPARFRLAHRIIWGLNPEPANAIVEQFGAHWVTVPNIPQLRRVTAQLRASPGVRETFADPHYLVFRLPASS